MMEFTSKKTNYKKFLAVAFVSMMAFSLSNTVAFAKGEGEEIEREFTIDVTAPVVEKEETLEPVKEKENEFIVDVNKPEVSKQTDTGSIVEVKKPTTPTSKVIGYDPYVPSKPSKARGTLTESVGSDNKAYPVRKEIKDSASKTSENGQNKERPKADAREFLTFTTKNGKVFHLIIDRDKMDENIQLLTEVSEQDLLNMIAKDEEANGNKMVGEKVEPQKEVVKKEEVVKEEPKKENSMGSFLVLILIAGLVGGAGYYFKVVKPKQDSLEDYEDDEVPNEDDYISEVANETTKGQEETEYTKEDLL